MSLTLLHEIEVLFSYSTDQRYGRYTVVNIRFQMSKDSINYRVFIMLRVQYRRCTCNVIKNLRTVCAVHDTSLE